MNVCHFNTKYINVILTLRFEDLDQVILVLEFYPS